MEKEKHSSAPNSPRSTSVTVNNGGTQPAAAAAPSPKSTPRSMDPANLTTFIHADVSSFKRVVQMLTGSIDTAAAKSATAPPPPAKAPPTGPKKPAFKLYECRRSNLKNLKVIGPLMPTLPPRKRVPPEISSPSVLGFPSLALTPVTPLIPDPSDMRQLNSSTVATVSTSSEDQAIAEKGFHPHPSPGAAEPPRLLRLFPVTSSNMSSTT